MFDANRLDGRKLKKKKNGREGSVPSPLDQCFHLHIAMPSITFIEGKEGFQ